MASLLLSNYVSEKSPPIISNLNVAIFSQWRTFFWGGNTCIFYFRVILIFIGRGGERKINKYLFVVRKNAEKARHVSEKAAALFFLEGHWNHYGALDKNRQSDFCVAAAVKSDMRNGHFFGQSHKHKKFYFKASDSFLRETASHRRRFHL